jgi:hypothetical protein
MKIFEIEVVRTYTTTIEIETSDHVTQSDVYNATFSNVVPEEKQGKGLEDLYDEIWDIIAEKELEQMDTGLESVKVKEL